jgi:diphthine-ammonia ligase
MQRNMILFSGGKDSMYALERVVEQEGENLVASITSKNGDTQLHAGPEANQSFRGAQLRALNFDTTKLEIGSSSNYLNELYEGLKHLVETNSIQQLVTGDLWHLYTNGIGDMLAGALNIPILRPARDACPSLEHGKNYALELVRRGIKSRIVSVRKGNLPRDFVGRQFDEELITELGERGIDPSGEGGEYQTIVTFSELMNQKLVIDEFDVNLVTGKNGKEQFYRMNIKGFHEENANRKY